MSSVLQYTNLQNYGRDVRSRAAMTKPATQAPKSFDSITGNNGWLSPRGQFYPCVRGQHRQVLDTLHLTGAQVELQGWIKIQCDGPASTIFVVSYRASSQRQTDMLFALFAKDDRVGIQSTEQSRRGAPMSSEIKHTDLQNYGWAITLVKEAEQLGVDIQWRPETWWAWSSDETGDPTQRCGLASGTTLNELACLLAGVRWGLAQNGTDAE